MVKVCSHPRSGTHFLEEFIARNFYPGKDLTNGEMTWGHWSDRQHAPEGKKNLKLFGTHLFPEDVPQVFFADNKKLIYIYRDGRAVAYSLWKSEHFLNKDWKGMSFSDFLKTPLDWKGGVGYKSNTGWTIAEHWSKHVVSWKKLSGKNCLVLQYDQLKNDPEKVYDLILKQYFPLKRLFGGRKKIDPVTDLIGLRPNKGDNEAWKSVFTTEDESLFLSRIDEELLKEFS